MNMKFWKFCVRSRHVMFPFEKIVNLTYGSSCTSWVRVGQSGSAIAYLPTHAYIEKDVWNIILKTIVKHKKNI